MTCPCQTDLSVYRQGWYAVARYVFMCVFWFVTGDFPFSIVGAARLDWSSVATPEFRFVQLHPVLIVGRRRP